MLAGCTRALAKNQVFFPSFGGNFPAMKCCHRKVELLNVASFSIFRRSYAHRASLGGLSVLPDMMRGEEEGFYEAPRALPDPDPPVISHGSSKWTQLQDSIVLAETALQG